MPPGTNGGVSLVGTLAGFLGAFVIALTSVVLLPFCGAHEGRLGGLSSAGKLGFQGGSGWDLQEKVGMVLAITIWGGLGSVLDSALGGWFQASVVDSRTGKVIEGTGGKKVSHFRGASSLFANRIQVLVTNSRSLDSKTNGKPSRRVESGLGVLDNNTVNLLMAFLMSIGGMSVASFVWNIPLQSIYDR